MKLNKTTTCYLRYHCQVSRRAESDKESTQELKKTDKDRFLGPNWAYMAHFRSKIEEPNQDIMAVSLSCHTSLILWI